MTVCSSVHMCIQVHTYCCRDDVSREAIVALWTSRMAQQSSRNLGRLVRCEACMVLRVIEHSLHLMG